ncbi:unnamed protein product [Trypanosoma congolense IL3000]|uniref:WGS project CAEQ00000000 data, annotated contig 1536 n=1 Tax=Trypanosoma congolense (strain IL3000) TaxID=1068625 RepID=F9W6Y6_TRYCI|nr:unnamed protein product [Trypanosoma congolense IL3000]
MTRKDRDVWDPPADHRAVPPPPSAFHLHFKDRALIVGKDGSNAQLITARSAKPLKIPHTINSTSQVAGVARIGGHPGLVGNGKVAPCAIRAPDEAPQKPLQRKFPQPRRPQLANCGGDGFCENRVVGAPLSDTAGDEKDAIAASSPTLAVSACLEVAQHRGNGLASLKIRAPPPPLAAKPLGSRSGVIDPFSISVDCVGAAVSTPLNVPSHATAEGLAFARPAPSVPLPNSPAQPQPRSTNGSSGVLMPKPAKPLDIKMPQSTKPCSSHSGSTMAEGNAEASNTLARGVWESDSEESLSEALPVPVYQPMGKLLHVMNNDTTPKRRKVFCNPSNSTAGCGISSGGGNGVRQAVTRATTQPCRKTGFSNSAPVVGPTSHPRRLQPLQGSIGSTDASPVAVKEKQNTTESEQGDSSKKRNITYKPHSLKEYKALMEQVANLKLGGLGPADTEERRNAMKRMQRQREYGTLVEKQVVEDIREKQQRAHIQKQGDQCEGGEMQPNSTNIVPGVIRQPPPPERVEAQERRARALEYAKQLPRVVPANTKKSQNNCGPSAVRQEKDISPLDEASRLRRQRLLELEARHEKDRERVTTVKRQLGF